MTWIYPTKAPLPEDYFGYKKKTEKDDEYEITITKYTYKKKKKKKGVSMPANDWFIQHADTLDVDIEFLEKSAQIAIQHQGDPSEWIPITLDRNGARLEEERLNR